MTSDPYTRQQFSDTAQRRAREARALLEHPVQQKQRDGAVMLALLAAECALKATLMHGYGLNSTDQANEEQQLLWFRGKNGHRLQILWGSQHASVKESGERPGIAVSELNKADSYAYRYGQKRPKREHADPFVDHSETLVQWMKDVLGIAP